MKFNREVIIIKGTQGNISVVTILGEERGVLFVVILFVFLLSFYTSCLEAANSCDSARVGS